MKEIVLALLAAMLFIVPCQSQPEKESQGFTIETMPAPLGGPDAFKTWINENNQLLNSSDTIDENDKVFVQFTVDTTGDITNVVIVRGFAPAYDKEAHRLVSTCPIQWKPALSKGKKVAVPFTMPIHFVDEPAKPDN